MHLNKPIGSNIINFDSLDSTNNYAMQLANEGNAEHGTTIITQYQTQGKGQQGKHWQAAKEKNLLLSFILDMSGRDIQSQFALNAACCTSVAHLLMEDYQMAHVSIKWPNDVYMGKNKIAGILIENVIRGINWQYAIVGIGLNVNQTDFPDDLRATSLHKELKQNISLLEVQQKLFMRLNKSYAHYCKKDEDLLAEYNSLLHGYQEEIEYRLEQKILNGRLLGADNSGLIQIDDKQYRHGEVQLFL